MKSTTLCSKLSAVFQKALAIDVDIAACVLVARPYNRRLPQSIFQGQVDAVPL